MKRLYALILVMALGLLIGGVKIHAQQKTVRNVAVNSSFKDGLKGWKIEKDGPGEFIIKVEKQGNKNVLHIIRKGSHRKKGFVSIYQEFDPPAKGDTAIIEIEAMINKQQLKTTGRWSKKDPKSACYPIHLHLYTPQGCVYDWGITTRDNPPGYPINYLRQDPQTWFFFDSVPQVTKGIGLKKAEVRCEGYDFDVEFRSIKILMAKEFESLKGRGF